MAFHYNGSKGSWICTDQSQSLSLWFIKACITGELKLFITNKDLQSNGLKENCSKNKFCCYPSVMYHPMQTITKAVILQHTQISH